MRIRQAANSRAWAPGDGRQAPAGLRATGRWAPRSAAASGHWPLTASPRGWRVRVGHRLLGAPAVPGSGPAWAADGPSSR
eukprot:3865464-Heterocapsa_arctica.AAC.1